MGCFSGTCAISGLPIGAGDPVRYLVLAQNAYNDSNKWACYVNGRWTLRSLPIQAEYNGYGSIERMKPGFLTRFMFECLDHGTIECGTGDNSCHDVPVRKGMSEKDWLTALWEGRVKAYHYFSRRPQDPNAPKVLRKVPRGVPTRKRVEKLLLAEGAKLADSRFAEEGRFIVSGLKRGYVRVRTSSYGANAKKHLEDLRPIIEKKYAAMIVPGSGNYADDAEMVVATPAGAGSEAKHYGKSKFRGRQEKPNCGVAQAMVREDVWQALLRMTTEDFAQIDGKYKTVDRTFEETLEAAKKYVAEYRGAEEKAKKLEATLRKLKEKEEKEDPLYMQLFDEKMDLQDLLFGDTPPLLGSFSRHRSSGTTFALREVFRLAMKKNLKRADQGTLIRAMAEVAHVENVLATIRYQWNLGGSGSQSPEWKPQIRFHAEMLDIAKRQQAALDEEEDE